jgi:hypothetical protein
VVDLFENTDQAGASRAELAAALTRALRLSDVQARAAARDGEAVRDQGHSSARQSVDQFAKTADLPIRTLGRPWGTLSKNEGKPSLAGPGSTPALWGRPLLLAAA